MYTSLYLFRVPLQNISLFLHIQQETAEIYVRYGALRDETFIARNRGTRQLYLTFVDTIDFAEYEVLLIGMRSFRDRKHHDEVMQKAGEDERIGQLYQDMTRLLDIGRVIRGEFERMVALE